jgi:Zn-dependent protease
MFITVHELFDILLMTAFLGFLFKDFYHPPSKRHQLDLPLAQPRDWSGFWFAVKIMAPPIILHELAHKFVALSFGFDATFHAFYHDPTTLVLGVLAIVAKFLNFGFFLIVPGFVETAGAATPLQAMLISFAGPAIHLIFWVGATLWLRNARLSRNKAIALSVTARINMFLFIFNMLPIPPFDGWSVISNLLTVVGVLH